MKIKKTEKTFLRLLCCMAATIMTTGCIKDDLAGCKSSLPLTVRVYAQSEVELDADEVRDVSLFIFDSDSCFIQKIDTQIGERVTIDIPTGGDIHIVAWGNLSQSGKAYSQPEPGDLLKNCFIELQPTTHAATYALSPGDFFRGEITIEGNDRSGDKVLPIYREVGSMTVTVRNLKKFTGFTDDDYSIVVRETGSNIGFDGQIFGDRVAYFQEGAFVDNNGKDEYRVPAFNMLPESSGIYIDIYYGTQRIITFSSNNTGQPITIEKGKLTNVLIDLDTSAEAIVSISIGAWGDYAGEKEF